MFPNWLLLFGGRICPQFDILHIVRSCLVCFFTCHYMSRDTIKAAYTQLSAYSDGVSSFNIIKCRYLYTQYLTFFPFLVHASISMRARSRICNSNCDISLIGLKRAFRVLTATLRCKVQAINEQVACCEGVIQ